LAQLVALPSWRAYSKLLESVGEQLLTEIVRGLPHEQYIAKCGELKMLERLMELPSIIIDKVTKLEDHKNARQQSIADADRFRDTTFVSTPFWNDYLRAK
jgi:hypothetical protein